MSIAWRTVAAPILVLSTMSVAACGSPSTARTTAVARPTSTATPTPAPSLAPQVQPPPPYSVIVTNQGRQGSTYDVIMLDDSARMVARTTAKLPLLKANETVELPLVSASNDLVYYLDGDTEIRSLAPDGATTLVKTIAAGATSILGFAVSPDDQRIAVALIDQQRDSSKDVGHGYVEDLADTANHVDLFSNTAADAFRWPAGWHGNAIVDAAGSPCEGYQSNGFCGTSYHVIDSTTGVRTATICETPATQAVPTASYYQIQGNPVSGGVACSEYQYPSAGGQSTTSFLAVDWAGNESAFVSSTASLPVFGCSLAPGGALMVCQDSANQALTTVTKSGTSHDLGRRYTVLGWIDGQHLVVGVDSKTLGVLSADSGAVATVSIAGADMVTAQAALPGAL